MAGRNPFLKPGDEGYEPEAGDTEVKIADSGESEKPDVAEDEKAYENPQDAEDEKSDAIDNAETPVGDAEEGAGDFDE